MRVNVSPQANKDNPVALDLVLVKDKELLKDLMNLSAKEWFENRNQYQLDYPEEIELSSHRWEWVPGQAVYIDPILLKGNLAGGIIFANYFTPGTHSAVIDPRKSVVVNLGAETITVTQGE
jgi:type VI secretion system protein